MWTGKYTLLTGWNKNSFMYSFSFHVIQSQSIHFPLSNLWSLFCNIHNAHRVNGSANSYIIMVVYLNDGVIALQLATGVYNHWTGLVDWRFAGNIYVAIVNLWSGSIKCCTILLSMTRGILWGRPDDDGDWNKNKQLCCWSRSTDSSIACTVCMYVCMYVLQGYIRWSFCITFYSN